MLEFRTAVIIFFRFANFAMLIGVFVYLFKKYVYQSLCDQIAQKFAFIKGLQQKTVLLQEEKSTLVEEIAQQTRQCKKLVQQINIWKQVVADEREIKRQEYEKSRVRQKERSALQTAYLQREQLKQAVLPHAVINAKEELTKLFAAQDRGHTFIKNVIAQLNKSMHNAHTKNVSGKHTRDMS